MDDHTPTYFLASIAIVRYRTVTFPDHATASMQQTIYVNSNLQDGQQSQFFFSHLPLRLCRDFHVEKLHYHDSA